MHVKHIEHLRKTTCGIYCIRNFLNNKMYIGSSKNVKDRVSSHKHFLRGRNKERPTHKNEHLQRDWILYGEQCFEFVLIEECSPDVLLEREQFYMDKFRQYLYNVTDAIRTTLPEEMKQNISKGNKGKPKSESHRQALSEAHTGKAWSEERKAAHKVGVQDKALTLEKAKEIRLLKAEGCTYKQLAEKYDVSERTIYDIVSNKYHKEDDSIVLTKKRKSVSKATKDTILARVNAGENVYDLAKEFDIHASTIYRYMKKGER